MAKLKKAFTLVELMVVITVIAILMTIAIVSFTRIQKQARDTKRKADMRTIATALQAYYTEQQQYPVAVDETTVDVALADMVPTYLPSVPIPPVGATGAYADEHQYIYISGPNGYTYALCTELETATGSGTLWVVNTTYPAGFLVDDEAGACAAALPSE